jgi:tetratricopeptide (TPR) repeat protein
MVGYPGHDTKSWPKPGHEPVASFHEGIVSRLTTFKQEPDGDSRLLQYVQHTAAGWFEFSGSPVFLPNGHVIAVHNSGTPVSKMGLSTQLSHSIRIDALRELLAFHGLNASVPLPVKKDELLLARYSAPNPDSENFRRAVGLYEECLELQSAGDYWGAKEKCDGAIRLAPPDPMGMMFVVETHFRYFLARDSDVAPAQRELAKYQKLINLLDLILSGQNIEPLSRSIILTRRSWIRDQMGDAAGALADLTSIIESTPSPSAYEYRARHWEKVGRPDLAADDRRRAEELAKQPKS